jgi:hypothetical protein
MLTYGHMGHVFRIQALRVRVTTSFRPAALSANSLRGGWTRGSRKPCSRWNWMGVGIRWRRQSRAPLASQMVARVPPDGVEQKGSASRHDRHHEVTIADWLQPCPVPHIRDALSGSVTTQ